MTGRPALGRQVLRIAAIPLLVLLGYALAYAVLMNRSRPIDPGTGLGVSWVGPGRAVRSTERFTGTWNTEFFPVFKPTWVTTSFLPIDRLYWRLQWRRRFWSQDDLDDILGR